MSDYLVQGKKGSGKSLSCVGRIRDALMQGRPVATNLDIYMEHLLPPHMKNVRCIRLPDRPTRADLDALGTGNDDKSDESKNGLIVLDEVSTFLNARQWGDKGRQAVLDYFAHTRKLGWDTYFLCQGQNQIDKQLREALTEYNVTCRRMDKLKIPVLGIKLPRVHVAFVKYGHNIHDMIAERWIYRGNNLFQAYNTRQIFHETNDFAIHSYLPPWHLGGYAHRSPMQRFKDAIDAEWARRTTKPAPKPKHPLVALIERLPADQRLKHLQRFDGLNAFSADNEPLFAKYG